MTKSFKLRNVLPCLLATTAMPGIADTHLPATVEEELARMSADCAAVGGEFDRADAIASADFTGDGITDYLLETKKVRCSTAASLYTGNSGGQVLVYEGTATGNATLGFQSGVNDVNIDRQFEPAQLALGLGGKRCGQAVTSEMSRADYQVCWRPLLWNR